MPQHIANTIALKIIIQRGGDSVKILLSSIIINCFLFLGIKKSFNFVTERSKTFPKNNLNRLLAQPICIYKGKWKNINAAQTLNPHHYIGG